MTSVAQGLPVRKDVTPSGPEFTQIKAMMNGVTVWTPDWAQALKDPPADVARWQQVTGS